MPVDVTKGFSRQVSLWRRLPQVLAATLPLSVGAPAWSQDVSPPPASAPAAIDPAPSPAPADATPDPVAPPSAAAKPKVDAVRTVSLSPAVRARRDARRARMAAMLTIRKAEQDLLARHRR